MTEENAGIRWQKVRSLSKFMNIRQAVRAQNGGRPSCEDRYGTQCRRLGRKCGKGEGGLDPTNNRLPPQPAPALPHRTRSIHHWTEGGEDQLSELSSGNVETRRHTGRCTITLNVPSAYPCERTVDSTMSDWGGMTFGINDLQIFDFGKIIRQLIRSQLIDAISNTNSHF